MTTVHAFTERGSVSEPSALTYEQERNWLQRRGRNYKERGLRVRLYEDAIVFPDGTIHLVTKTGEEEEVEAALERLHNDVPIDMLTGVA